MKSKRIILIVCIFVLVTGISDCKDKSVKDNPVELTDILVSPPSISLTYGGNTPDTQQITVQIVPENVIDITLKWSSGNNNIATVSPTGLVTATGVGSTLITVSAGNLIQKKHSGYGGSGQSPYASNCPFQPQTFTEL